MRSHLQDRQGEETITTTPMDSEAPSRSFGCHPIGLNEDLYDDNDFRVRLGEQDKAVQRAEARPPTQAIRGRARYRTTLLMAKQKETDLHRCQ